MTLSRSPHKLFGGEQLESRLLMAGDVTAYVSGQMLVIWGDSADNGVALTYNSSSQSYQVSGTTAGGDATTINGLDTTQAANAQIFSGVKGVYVGLNAGDDSFEIGSPAAVDTVIQQWLTIDMGDGDDTVSLGKAGNGASVGSPVARSLAVGTSLNVNLGAGDDTLTMANANIGLAMNLTGGDGNDQISFNTEYTPAGAVTPTIFPVKVNGNAQISLGGGDDQLVLRDTAVQGNLSIYDGAGAANIQVFNVGVKNSLSINTSDQADTVNLQYFRAKQLSLNTNSGVDTVYISNGTFTTMNIKLGAGLDHLHIDTTKTSLAANLDGGPGLAILSGTGNSLHGQLRRNFG